MRFTFATWLLEKEQGEALTAVGARIRLVSYFHTIEKETSLKYYVQTGRNPNASTKIKITRNS